MQHNLNEIHKQCPPMPAGTAPQENRKSLDLNVTFAGQRQQDHRFSLTPQNTGMSRNTTMPQSHLPLNHKRNSCDSARVHQPVNNSAINRSFAKSQPNLNEGGTFVQEAYNYVEAPISTSSSCESTPANIYSRLNKVYEQRLLDIDRNAYGDKDLKLTTFEEWVFTLQQINETILKDMENLESNVLERLQLLQRKVNLNCRHSQDSGMIKCRKDLGETQATWQESRNLDLDQMNELPSGSQSRNNSIGGDQTVDQRNKLLKALAFEVAAKHDEVLELKKQIVCLEDEIQKAQQKIQLKDDVIKELRNDLKRSSSKFESRGSFESCIEAMSPMNYEHRTSQSESIDEAGSITPKFCDMEAEQEAMNTLTEEVQQLLQLNKTMPDLLHKLASEKKEMQNKLNSMRNRLAAFESNSGDISNDCDSGISSKYENDDETKMFENLRLRFRNLTENNMKLKRTINELEKSNLELNSRCEFQKDHMELNDKMLNEIAALLCNEEGGIIDYNKIYGSASGNLKRPNNPFCDAIINIIKHFEEREAKLLKALSQRNEKIEDLSQTLKETEMRFLENNVSGDCPHSSHLETKLQQQHLGDQSQHLNPAHDSYLKIIDDLKTDLEQITCEVVQVQRVYSQPGDGTRISRESDLEASLQELERQNDKLEKALTLATMEKDAAYTELKTNNETLKSQIEHLQCTIVQRNQEIMKLRSMMINMHQIPPAMLMPGQEFVNSIVSCSSNNKEAEKRIEQVQKELDCSRQEERVLNSEIRKLQATLNESKRKNGELMGQIHRITCVLKNQQSQEKAMESKHEKLKQDFEAQYKLLKDANMQLATLKIMEKRENELSTERNLLQGELLGLKEKEAALLGSQRIMRIEIQRLQKELHTARDIIKRQQHFSQEADCNHRKAINQLQNKHFEVERKLQIQTEDFDRLKKDYENQNKVLEQTEKVIKIYRQWKEEQLMADIKTRNQLSLYEQHVQTLKEDRECLKEHYDSILRDQLILQDEFERITSAAYSYPIIHGSGSTTMEKRLAALRRVKLRAEEHSDWFDKDIVKDCIAQKSPSKQIASSDDK